MNHIKLKSLQRLLLIFAVLSTLDIGLLAQGTTIKSINSNGLPRSFRVHLPVGFNANDGLPLVFNFHGFGSSAIEQEIYSGMSIVSDQNSFVVVYPEGISKAWNVGWAFGSTANDVKFVSDMIDYMTKEYNINTKKVYACGMSNGGFMSYKLACDLNDRITAIASVTGSMVASELKKCSPPKTIPILEIHGTADDVVAYNGTFGISQPIIEVLNFWRDHNDCDLVPTNQKLPKLNAQEITNTEVIRYINCNNDHEVLHYKVNKGGHTWPGSSIAVGVTSQDFNASEEIWKFFNRFETKVVSNIHNQTIIDDYGMHKYSNPIPDVLSLELNQDTELIIFNISGQVIHTQSLLKNNNLINLSQLSSGLYFMHLRSNQTNKTFKIIK